MNNSLINSLVGMQSLQQKIDSIANNISNMNTVGYKSRDVYFQEILTSRINQPNEFNLEGRKTTLGLDKGYGSRTSLTLGNFSQGQPLQTGLSSDFMLKGENLFFTVAPKIPYEENQLKYTRDGHFQLDANRNLVTDNGDFVLDDQGDSIYIPEGREFAVDSQGRIIVENSDGEKQEVGAIKVTKINTPQTLENVGENLYQIPQELLNDDNLNIIDKEYSLLNDTSNQFAVIQGALEAPNVDLAKEMVQLNETQRSYQFLSRGISISDQMMAIANNIKG